MFAVFIQKYNRLCFFLLKVTIVKCKIRKTNTIKEQMDQKI